MSITRVAISMFCCGLTLLGANMASAQNLPDKTIRIVASGAGGNTDALARLIAPRLSTALGQSVFVENRNAAILAEQTVATAVPDGTTLLIDGSNLWFAPLLEDRQGDPVADFAPVIILLVAPNVLVVHPSVPVKSLKELIALAKAKPGELNYSSGTTGAIGHLATELLKSMAGVNIVRVAYNGGGAATVALLGGQVQLSILPPVSVSGQVAAGKLRALAVTSSQPTTLLPGVPTMAAAGLPGYEAIEIIGMLAPAKTPVPIINRLNQEILKIVNQADMKDKFSSGLDIPDRSPEAYAAAIKSSRQKMDKVIKSIVAAGETKK